MDRLSRKEQQELFAFLDTGKLGNIWVGMTKTQIIDTLGMHDGTSNPNVVLPPREIYVYGDWLHLTFEEEVLTYINLRYDHQAGRYLFTCLSLPKTVNASWASKMARWNFSRVRSLLKLNNKSYYFRIWQDDTITIQIPNGGFLAFMGKKRNELCKIANVPHSYVSSNMDGWTKCFNPKQVIRWPRAEKRKRRFINMHSRI